MDAFEQIGNSIEDFANAGHETHPFYVFEPFDIEERSKEIKEVMRADGIDLYSEKMSKHIGADPHPFQNGFLKSIAKLRGLIAGTQAGKAQPKDSKVLTPDGFRLMGDIEFGDFVLGPEGDWRKVIGVHPQGERPIYKLTFDDQASCECDIDHLWTYLPKKRASARTWEHGNVIPNPRHNITVTKTTRELIDDYGVGLVPEHRRPIFPVVGRLDLSESLFSDGLLDLPVPAYSFGALLGDGCFRMATVTITCDDRHLDIIARMNQELNGALSKHSDKYTWGVLGMVSTIKSMGMHMLNSSTKYIPDEYKNQTYDNRLALLRGLMDTDGSIYGKGSMEYYSKSKRLAEDTAWIVRSLGGKAKIKTKNTGYLRNSGKWVDCGIGYRVTIKIGTNPFHTKLKSDRFYEISRRKERILHRIDYVGMKDAQCITIDAKDGLYVTDDFIVTHNSICAFVEGLIMTTGDIPISLRYAKGIDTGVKRVLSRENIHRWGRFDSVSGAFIDKDYTAPIPEGWDEWNCGNIIGVGRYPEEKIAPEGSVVWIGTYKEAFDQFWWPRFYPGPKCWVPEHLIDTSRGNNGFQFKEQNIHLVRDSKIHVITYEQKHQRFEAEKVWAIIMDEEPSGSEGPKIFQSVQQHAHFISMVETPYEGITFTEPLLFPDEPNPEVQVFHATQYDSPYHINEEVEIMKANMDPWDVGARVYGLHTEATGKPYFDRTKISGWVNKFTMAHTIGRFIPTREYRGIHDEDIGGTVVSGLLSVPVDLHEVDMDNKQDCWKIYEDVMEGVGYMFTGDPAEGAENPQDAADVCAGMISRNPFPNENQDRPKIVATLASTLPTAAYARTCSHALRYYNNALLAPESPKRGSANAVFGAELKDWPWWYKMVTIQDSTRRPRAQMGFDTNSRTRNQIFELITDWLNQFDYDDYPEIPDPDLLKELAAAVVGKNNRCDHTRRSTLDRAVCFGIMLYVVKHSAEQITCNVETETRGQPYERFANLISVEGEKPDFLGTGNYSWR